MLKTGMVIDYLNGLRKYANNRLAELETYVGSDDDILSEREELEAFSSNRVFSIHDAMLGRDNDQINGIFELCGFQAENPICQYAVYLYADLNHSIEELKVTDGPNAREELTKRIRDFRNMLLFLWSRFTATEISKTFVNPMAVKPEDVIKANKNLQHLGDPEFWEYLPISVIEERLNAPEYYAFHCMANGRFNTKKDKDVLERRFLLPLVFHYMDYGTDTYFSSSAFEAFKKMIRRPWSVTEFQIKQVNSEVYISFSYDKDLNIGHPVTFKLKFLRLSDGTYKLVADTQCGYIEYSDERIDFFTEEGFFANDYFASDEIFLKDGKGIPVTKRKFERIFYFI